MRNLREIQKYRIAEVSVHVTGLFGLLHAFGENSEQVASSSFDDYAVPLYLAFLLGELLATLKWKDRIKKGKN